MNGGKTRMGMLMFVLSEAVFFLLLVLAYVTYHRQHGNGPTASNSLDPIKTGVFSLCLFSSSGTMALAMRGFRGGLSAEKPEKGRARRRSLAVALFATFALGAVFLVGQGMEYAALLRANVTISRDLFGTTFFTLTGFHGLHVTIGLIMIASLLGMALRGGSRQPRPGTMEAVSIYWHFVDVVWVVIFSVVYLWAFL